MNAHISTRIFDWGDMVALANDGQHPPATTYEFSNGRKFTRVRQPLQDPPEADGPNAETLTQDPYPCPTQHPNQPQRP
ncbi:MAG: hypothetical protein HW380_217 [Magnetococcales bacterium]|nr:hypothetical protein [Magnetococcales bacterium]